MATKRNMSRLKRLGERVVKDHCDQMGWTVHQDWSASGLRLVINDREVDAPGSILLARASAGRAPLHQYLKELCDSAGNVQQENDGEV